MKKSHKFDELSETKKCNCGRKIKKRFENTNTHDKCFKCYSCVQKKRGHIMKSNLKM